MKTLFKFTLAILLFAGSLSAKAQVPVLNSYPSSDAVIFLDFDGQSVINTSWNYNGPIYCGASGMSNADITETFNRVAEDYRPFDINVTTDSAKYFAAPINKRTRVILTVTSDWYGAAGGVAFVGSFTWGDNTPCFVFTQLLGTSNPKNIAEATSHEAGHTLGLYHQSSYDASCIKISDYNFGQGSGEISWAPIMGVGYYRNLTLWNNGPNSYGCSNLQSDLSIITSATNGISFRLDDFSNSFATSAIVPITNNQFEINGVIEENIDQDIIKFIMPAYGRFKLDAIPFNVGAGSAGSDLDLQVSLYDNSQTLINVYNPGNLLNSVIDSNINAGNYFLKIEGKGNIYAPNYASLGSYSLKADITMAALPLKRLELRGSINNDEHQLNWIIDADEQATKQVLEISEDGRNFTVLSQTNISDRAYAYKPFKSSAVQYRLKVTFENGQQFYSNTVTLRNKGAISKPYLMNNLIAGDIVEVNSPAMFQYVVYGLNGNILNRGTLINGSNNINIPGIVSGMYLIRFANGTEQSTDKFVKQ